MSFHEAPIDLTASQTEWPSEAQIDRLYECMNSGAPFDPPDKIGWNPLHTVCATGDSVQVKVVLERGMDVNAAVRWPLNCGTAPLSAPSDGWTSLHEAAAHGNHDVVATLLSNGAAIGCTTRMRPDGHGGTTPLEVAVDQGHIECCAQLLAQNRNTVVQKLEGGNSIQKDLKDVCADYANVIRQALVLLDSGFMNGGRPRQGRTS